MTSKMEKLKDNKVKLEIQVDGSQFEEAISAAYHKTAGRWNVPGFRKGKAPRKVIETHYGKSVFYQDAFEILYPQVYAQAVQQHEVTPIDHPDIDIEQIDEDGVKFIAEVVVKPEVKLGDYKGIEVAWPVYTVTDEQVENEVKAMQERSARFVEANRPVENGDMITLDYAGTIEGVAFEGGTAEKQLLEVGSGRFIPGFEEQLIGLSIDEEKDVQVNFPKEYHAPELANKAAVFHVKIKEIKGKELPALDDEFAKDVSEFDTLEALRADIRKKMEEQNDRRAENEFENTLIEKVTEKAEVDAPEIMIERQIDYMVRDMEIKLQYQGLNMDDFLKYTGSSKEELRNKYKDDAKNRVKASLVMEAIQKAEEITATAEEIEKEIESFAGRMGKTVEEFKKTLRPQDNERFEDEVIYHKTMELLKSASVAKKA